MTEDQDKTLCQTFPLLYRNRHGDIRSTGLCWGFECGPGWYGLIYELSAKLEKMIKALPPGDPDYVCCATQVKEKFAGLRFYMTRTSDDMDDVIDEAVAKSYKTCEQCGAAGRIRGRYWYSVQCDACHLKSAIQSVMNICSRDIKESYYVNWKGMPQREYVYADEAATAESLTSRILEDFIVSPPRKAPTLLNRLSAILPSAFELRHPLFCLRYRYDRVKRKLLRQYRKARRYVVDRLSA